MLTVQTITRSITMVVFIEYVMLCVKIRGITSNQSTKQNPIAAYYEYFKYSLRGKR